MKHKKHILSVLAGIVAAFLLVSMLADVLPKSAKAESASQLKEQLNELEEKNDKIEAELDSLRGQLSDNLDELTAMVAQKDLVDQEIALLHQQMENLNTQISAYSLLIADKQDELDKAQSHLSQLQIKNKERIRAMEENGELSYWSVLFQASSFNEMLDRMEMIQEIAKADMQNLQEMDAAAKEVASVKEGMVAEQEALQVKRDEMDAVEVQLEEKRAETDELLIQLKARGDEYEAMIMESERLMLNNTLIKFKASLFNKLLASRMA